MKYDLYHTKYLRIFLRCLGFVADKTTANDTAIIYRHSCDDFHKYISLPKVNVPSKKIVEKIMERLENFPIDKNRMDGCSKKLIKLNKTFRD